MENIGDGFTFEISLTVLNHLGRNLYRSFMTVLGEAISNAWDADAENVWIWIDRGNNSLIVKDDGVGMTFGDFQEKFLKIGYSKRKESPFSKEKNRSFIGRKGIGKLALLSCAQSISVLSKKIDTNYVGGVIDNSELNEAIENDLSASQYHLGLVNEDAFDEYKQDHLKGTILYFQNINGGIKTSTEYLRKLLALYFRFALYDNNFNIYVDGQVISLNDLDFLANKTEFLWKINDINDPYVTTKLTNLKESKALTSELCIHGFIASAEKPRDLKIPNTDEKVSIDLFVNGRLRERDLLRHIPTARVPESYLYGQIHFDGLDDEVDRFTSSREGVVADDPKFRDLLKDTRGLLSTIIDDWDKWRVKHRADGDPENTRMTTKERASTNLFIEVSKEYVLPVESSNRQKVDAWVDELANDAQFNFSSYADCFVSENLLRKYIVDKAITVPQDIVSSTEGYQRRERNYLQENNMIEIRRSNDCLSYLSMHDLAKVADLLPSQDQRVLLKPDADNYKTLRDAMAHTALLTEAAKARLTSVYMNIKDKIRYLLMS